MVTFERVKAKSMFSKLCATSINKPQRFKPENTIIAELKSKQENDSQSFLEALKSGGVWLS